MTAATGTQARPMPICLPISTLMSVVEETRVTMIAVAIDRRSEGICATSPSPIESST
ncbi:hypothetical protein CESP606_21755 [Cereibacter sphaeroides]